MNIKSLKSGLIGAAVALAITAALVACTADSSNDTQNKYSDAQGKAAQAKWGNPNVTNFTEYKLAIEVAALRDQPNLVNYAYLQSMDGSLRCYGKVIGFGIPYGTQITPPSQVTTGGGSEPVREPNALFMPDNAAATWIRVVDETTGKTYVDYVEPNLVVSQRKLPCKPLDQ